MGGWFVATAIGNKLTMIGLLWPSGNTRPSGCSARSFACVMTIVLFLLLRPLKKAMPGV